MEFWESTGSTICKLMLGSRSWGRSKNPETDHLTHHVLLAHIRSLNEDDYVIILISPSCCRCRRSLLHLPRGIERRLAPGWNFKYQSRTCRELHPFQLYKITRFKSRVSSRCWCEQGHGVQGVLSWTMIRNLILSGHKRAHMPSCLSITHQIDHFMRLGLQLSSIPARHWPKICTTDL